MIEKQKNDIKIAYWKNRSYTLERLFTKEVEKNNKLKEQLDLLEKIAGYPIIGMSYPCGE
mgnify:CR=1 FL=1